MQMLCLAKTLELRADEPRHKPSELSKGLASKEAPDEVAPDLLSSRDSRLAPGAHWPKPETAGRSA